MQPFDALRRLLGDREPESLFALDPSGESDREISPDILALRAKLQVAEGQWEQGINTLHRVLVRNCASTADVVSWMPLIADTLRAAPSGAKVTPEVAGVCLAACFGHSPLAVEEADSLRDGLARLDWEGAIARCDESPEICTCLACLVQAADLRAIPSVAALGGSAEKLRTAMVAHRDAPGESLFVNEVLRSLEGSEN
jgi:hypothetical protein